MIHPNLWIPVLPVVIPQIIITVLVFTFVHIWFYPPQAFVATFFNGPTGLITSWFAILQQSGIISRMIIEKTILPGPLKKIFDSVLRQNAPQRFISKVVAKEIEEKKEKEKLATRPVGEVLKSQLMVFSDEVIYYISNPYYWIKFFLIIFFNLFPFFGPYILIFLRSPGKARNLHERYYAIQEFNKEDIKTFFNANRAFYTSFGVVALNLELIPVVGMFFTYTNIVGASLWAAQLEKDRETKIKLNQLK
ncbi:hypothetical protein DASC09_013950 [Saccharomycopsis crataegensis]|uniref:Uncharacterized protein n=1 Tax=Saccharomycopsis crataegensis TaxID=43959 RepID=A0AAV5QI59_9ASCO|nr:hypothetical protein DASC09_013950 [Saccharomycopsis crataegensis]